MERFLVRTIELTWDPQRRLAHIRFTDKTEAREEDARQLVAQLAKWIGEDGRPFALAGDGGKLARLDAGYRSTWATFFKAHRDQVTIAFYNMGPIIRIAAEMFRLGTGVNMKAFGTEEEARGWLRTRGFDA